MSEVYPKLGNPPIIEAVLDFDCDVPPGKSLKSLEQSAKDAFHAQYPDAQPRYLQEVRVATGQDGGFNSSLQRSLQAWMFGTSDGKQLVQVRQSGFSFNRLAPYAGFDACLPEIERAWRRYCGIVAPIVLRTLRLRYINRIALPVKDVEEKRLDHFLRVQAALPAKAGLVASGFLNQYQATDPKTHWQAAVVIASQPPKDGYQPIMFDNTVMANGEWDPADWGGMVSVLNSLRELKNRIFFHAVKRPCLKLFR